MLVLFVLIIRKTNLMSHFLGGHPVVPVNDRGKGVKIRIIDRSLGGGELKIN